MFQSASRVFVRWRRVCAVLLTPASSVKGRKEGRKREKEIGCANVSRWFWFFSCLWREVFRNVRLIRPAFFVSVASICTFVPFLLTVKSERVRAGDGDAEGVRAELNLEIISFCAAAFSKPVRSLICRSLSFLCLLLPPFFFNTHPMLLRPKLHSAARNAGTS